ncbi:Uncharacterised protein [Vibrio cholerae]|nr:Uncharacterised protein [Vibrio cholerae]CSD12154.1 Uncharacterised protein [Vibrio cholerae]CSI76833.1 Uncharacterised protein [Vibrio cholerae]
MKRSDDNQTRSAQRAALPSHKERTHHFDLGCQIGWMFSH